MEAATWRCSKVEEMGGPIGDVASHCFYVAEFMLGKKIRKVAAVSSSPARANCSRRSTSEDVVAKTRQSVAFLLAMAGFGNCVERRLGAGGIGGCRAGGLRTGAAPWDLVC